jgi:hypothetical protein
MKCFENAPSEVGKLKLGFALVPGVKPDEAPGLGVKRGIPFSED